MTNLEQRINDKSFKAWDDYSKNRKPNPLDKEYEARYPVLSDKEKNEIISSMSPEKAAQEKYQSALADAMAARDHYHKTMADHKAMADSRDLEDNDNNVLL